MGVIITIQDARSVPGHPRAGYCSQGMRSMAERAGFDYLDFVKNGIDSDLLRSHVDDAMVDNLIKEAEKRHAREG